MAALATTTAVLFVGCGASENSKPASVASTAVPQAASARPAPAPAGADVVLGFIVDEASGQKVCTSTSARNCEPIVEMLEPSTYTYYDLDGQGFNVRFTIPGGWAWHDRELTKGGVDPPRGAAILFFGGPVQVYADPCHWAGASSDLTKVPTVNPALALAAQPLRSATHPGDRPADALNHANRWAGTEVVLTVPDDIDFAECDGGAFRSWGRDDGARSHQGPRQRDLVWAVDIYGVGGQPGGLIIDAATFPDTPPDVMSEIEAILESVAVGHWG